MLQISAKSTAQFLSNSCFKNGTQKRKFPVWRIPIRSVARDFFTFQLDNDAPTHQAGDVVEFLSRNTPDFISLLLWPPKSPDLNPVDCEVWGVRQQRLYRSRIRDVDHLKQCLIEEWRCFDQTSLTEQFDSSGMFDYECVSVQTAATLSTNCN